MEGIVIAITGTIAAIGGLYAAYVELNKRQLDSKDLQKKSDLDEFGQLLKGYKDLKDEYEEQVKQLRAENKSLHEEIIKMRATMRDYEKRLREFENKQKTMKEQVKEIVE